MVFCGIGHKMGFSKDVSNDGRVFEHLTVCGLDEDVSTCRLAVSSDTVLEGANDFQSIPKFAKLDLVIDYVTTPKFSFLAAKRVSVVK